jgi:hypothetical protein
VRAPMSRPSVVLISFAFMIVTGCGASSSPGVEVVQSDRAGVTVFDFREIPALEDESSQWGVRAVRSIPTAPDPGGTPLLYEPRGLTRMPDGTIVALDIGDERLVVIGPESNRVVARFAGWGGGPGEIASGRALLQPGADGTIWVLDGDNQRVSVFSVDGALVNEIALPRDGSLQGNPRWRPGAVDLFSRRIWITDFATNALTDSIVSIDLLTSSLRTVMPLPPRIPPPADMPAGRIPVWHPRWMWTVLASGQFVVGRTDRGVYQVHAPTGEQVAELRLPLSPRSISELDRRTIMEELGSMPSLGGANRISDAFPVANALYSFGDSSFALYHGRYATPAEDSRIVGRRTVWRVLSTSGEYMGSIHFPEGFSPQWTDGRLVLGVARDSLGVATIQELELVPPARSQPWLAGPLRPPPTMKPSSGISHRDFTDPRLT